jgi:serine/threonine protein kinase, bacterial
VDSTGNVYVTDDAKKQILKLSAGSTTPTALSVPSTTFANGPYGLAVDHTGNIYVTDGSQVVKLAAG